MTHLCHWPDCGKPVPPKMWGCREHWFTLPKRLRDLIWDAYVPGQEITKTPSAAYLAAAKQVQTWIAAWKFAQKRMVELANAPKVIIIKQTKPMGCDLCGKVAELRPYGPKGEQVCFECGMKDEAAAKRTFQKRLETGDQP